MKWFVNLSTRNKLFFSLGLLVVFMAIVIVIAYFNILALQKSQQTLFEDDFIIVRDLMELRSEMNRQRGQVLEMTLTTDRRRQEEIERDIRDRAKLIDDTIKVIIDLRRNDPRFVSRVEELKSLLVAYRQTRGEQIAKILEGKSEEARQLGLSAQEERFEKLRILAVNLAEETNQTAKNRIAESSQKADQAIRIFAIMGLLAFLLSVGLVLFLTRVIASPLAEISNVAERIAVGDLLTKINTNNRHDEVGALTQSFTRMTEYLRAMAEAANQIAVRDLSVKVTPTSDKDILGNAFAMMRENLHVVMREVQEAVGILASSSNEIVAMTTKYSSSAAETATAVNQTSTTVEEVKQTSHLSSQKARYVSDSSQKAAQTSQSGKQAVEQSIAGMTRIQEQMETIAENIVRLSEQSQSIGEIIATVNDLAEQSNLLAVNAAIEAARAGEQGKSFVVVAQEVKSLAEQSKRATAQVRALLGEIQKAMSAAVLATEQGSKSVEAGVKQSTEAGEAIKQLAESVSEAAQAATQIAASSQQQLVGMDQVATAMDSIKVATEQNVASTKQVEVSAQNLHELGLKLTQLVGQYKV